MANSVKRSAILGMIWTGIERFGTQIVLLLTEIVLARLLLPSDYGAIAMLAIFMAIAQSFVDSGFASALIQKKDRSEIDYSTAFWFNLLVSIVIYIILFVSAPYISKFYELPILTDVTRVYTLSIIINGLTIVQTAKLSIGLNFKSQAYASIMSVAVSGIVGIALAYCGYGVWALVAQGISISFVKMVALWLFSQWIPSTVFSFEAFRNLFSFGSKLLASGMINTIYSRIYTIVIGKAYNATNLGFFYRADMVAALPASTITQIVLKVNFPILSQYQDDDEKLLNAYKKILRPAVYILYPILIGLAVFASPTIEIVFGKQWLPCVPLLQLLCIGYLCGPLTHINLNLLYVKGRSDLVLKLELIKKPIAFAILFASLPFGLKWICVGKVVYDFIAFTFNCYYTGKFLGYGIIGQIRDISKILLNVALMTFVGFSILCSVHTPLSQLLVGVPLSAVAYLLVSYMIKDETFLDLVNNSFKLIHNR